MTLELGPGGPGDEETGRRAAARIIARTMPGVLPPSVPLEELAECFVDELAAYAPRLTVLVALGAARFLRDFAEAVAAVADRRGAP